MKNIHQIREVSTLAFNERVLQEAEDVRNPLMERLKFLGIFSSNMDEFFKVRVASIHRRIELGKRNLLEVLDLLARKSRELDERFRAAYDDIIAGLAREDVHLVTEKDLEALSAPGNPEDNQNSKITAWLKDYFGSNVLPKLVPIILQKNQTFPQLIDGALYFGIKMWGEEPRYAILEVPSDLPRFVELPNGNIMYIDDVIRFSLNEVFYIFEYDRIEAFEFKISRDAELDIDNDFSEGYIRKMQRVLQQRKGGKPTRLVFDATIPTGLRQMLLQELHISEDDTLIPGGRYHNMKDLISFPNRRKDLSFEKQPCAPHPVLDRGRMPMFEIVSQQDLLITYPYQSFDHVIRFLREAAIDPKVDSIRMTLYRAAHNSQVVNALVNAARNGKQVFVSIELQARFDERRNIKISQILADAGAIVVYGVPPMKTHCKLLLIERGKEMYAGLSTGNFNEITGRLYVDSILLTSDRRITREVADVFEFLNHASRMRTLFQPKFKHLLVSPFNSRKVLLKHIGEEEAKGPEGYVFLKVNHLTDGKVIKKIRDAADAGVKMDLIVRTTYAMLPHENVRAISILDRYLEHQRVYLFGKGPDATMYMSSADLMERNLDWRVEVAFPINDERLKQQVQEMMALQVRDDYKARILDETQSNLYVGGDTIRTQYATRDYLWDLYRREELPETPAPAPAPLAESHEEAQGLAAPIATGQSCQHDTDNEEHRHPG